MTFARTAEVTPIQVLSYQIRLLLPSAQSPSRTAVSVVEVPPGGSLPRHLHEVEEESYFMLDGELSLTIGEETRLLVPGDFGHVPPATAHAFLNPGQVPARFLAWTVGGPIDEFFVAMSQRVRRMPEDAPVMAELMSRYGIRVAGPSHAGPDHR